MSNRDRVRPCTLLFIPVRKRYGIYPQLTPEKCYASIRFLTADKAGIINSIKPTFLSSQPLLSNFVPTPLKVGSLKDSYSRLGYVITHATTQEKPLPMPKLI